MGATGWVVHLIFIIIYLLAFGLGKLGELRELTNLLRTSANQSSRAHLLGRAYLFLDTYIDRSIQII